MEVSACCDTDKDDVFKVFAPCPFMHGNGVHRLKHTAVREAVKLLAFHHLPRRACQTVEIQKTTADAAFGGMT
jgi:hypothetical protein